MELPGKPLDFVILVSLIAHYENTDFLSHQYNHSLAVPAMVVIINRESAWNARDLGLIPGSGRSPGEGNGNSLQYSCLENPMDREAWRATAHGVTKVSDMT